MTISAVDPKLYTGTEEKLSLFIRRVAQHGMLNRAAREAGIAYSTVWRHRKQNAGFDEAVIDAVNEALDHAEEKVWDLLNDPGTPESVQLKAAIFILRKRRPEVYSTPAKAENRVSPRCCDGSLHHQPLQPATSSTARSRPTTKRYLYHLTPSPLLPTPVPPHTPARLSLPPLPPAHAILRVFR